MSKREVEFGLAAQFCSIKEMLSLAKCGEEHGFKSFWVGEDYYWRGAFTVAATIAAHTHSIQVGLGVVNPHTRHPVLIAMETAALSEAVGSERVILGIGASFKAWIENQMNISYGKPRICVKETLEIIRAMFKGEAVQYDGQHFKLDGAQLSISPLPEIPKLYLGVEGPMNLELAGQIADGVLLTVFSSEKYLRFAFDHIKKGAARIDRSLENFDVQNYIVISMDEDREKARNAIKPFLGDAIGTYYPIVPHDNPIMRSVVDPEEERLIFEAFRRGEDLVPLISDDIIDGLAVAGTPHECQEKMQTIIDIGVTTPIAIDVPGVDLMAMIPMIKKFLFPEALKRGHY
jgi:5,10-methylenetetrahydromethanopterin reductase